MLCCAPFKPPHPTPCLCPKSAGDVGDTISTAMSNTSSLAAIYYVISLLVSSSLPPQPTHLAAHATPPATIFEHVFVL